MKNTFRSSSIQKADEYAHGFAFSNLAFGTRSNGTGAREFGDWITTESK